MMEAHSHGDKVTPYRIVPSFLSFTPSLRTTSGGGVGFTEWTNTAKARPLFRGHYQPHIPADLGFYDLRVPETRLAQANLAREYGSEGFCYYHYWLAGKRMIERPFNEVLASGQPDYPFCLCWANQTWTGAWHGAMNRILIEQTYPGRDDHRRHFEALLPAFFDRRYMTVDGKPIFVIFRPHQLPEPRATIDFWQELAVHAGLPGLFLVGDAHAPDWNPQQDGFDPSVLHRLRPKRRSWVPWSQPVRQITQKFFQALGRPTIYSYRRLTRHIITPPVDGIESYPCVIPNWDNTPRSGVNGLVIHGSTPELFREQLRLARARVTHLHGDHQIMFVKSWNEWAEGNHLEPDIRFGRRYLESLRDELISQ
jgi:hypothetical protein